MKPYWICDIESGPAAESVLAEIMPDFAHGKNLRDPAKIEADIAEKREAWFGSAALDAARGEILAVGIAGADLDAPTVILGEEKDILGRVRELATVYSDLVMVGHNLLGFDVPFLCRRMWHHGIRPPTPWLDCTPWRAKWAFDTMLAWSCGNRDQRISLDTLAWTLGCGRKTGNGADFAKLLASDREAAMLYLKKDLELTESVYLKMRS